MMKVRIHTRFFAVVLALITVLLSSCTERVDLELDSGPVKLVVYGTITSDSLQHRVQLSTSADYFSNTPVPAVSGAGVRISFVDTHVDLEEVDGEPGFYESPVAFRGVPGVTYRLEITRVDVNGDGRAEVYGAESTMPGGIELERIELKYFSLSSFFSGYQVAFWASHPPLQRDWFGFSVWKNDDLLTDSLPKYTILGDDLFDSGYFPGVPIAFLNDDDPRQVLQQGDTVTLEMHSLPREHYQFVSEAQQENAGNNPLFSGPPANIYTNIRTEYPHGAAGIFSAYQVERARTILE